MSELPTPTLPNPSRGIRTGKMPPIPPREHDPNVEMPGRTDNVAAYRAVTETLWHLVIILVLLLVIYEALPALHWLLDLFVARWWA
jgi:hypothetical protein